MNGEKMLSVDYIYLLAWVSLFSLIFTLSGPGAVLSINKGLAPKPRFLSMWLPAGHLHLAALQKVKTPHII